MKSTVLPPPLPPPPPSLLPLLLLPLLLGTALTSPLCQSADLFLSKGNTTLNTLKLIENYDDYERWKTYLHPSLEFKGVTIECQTAEWTVTASFTNTSYCLSENSWYEVMVLCGINDNVTLAMWAGQCLWMGLGEESRSSKARLVRATAHGKSKWRKNSPAGNCTLRKLPDKPRHHFDSLHVVSTAITTTSTTTTTTTITASTTDAAAAATPKCALLHATQLLPTLAVAVVVLSVVGAVATVGCVVWVVWVKMVCPALHRRKQAPQTCPETGNKPRPHEPPPRPHKPTPHPHKPTPTPRTYPHHSGLLHCLATPHTQGNEEPTYDKMTWRDADDDAYEKLDDLLGGNGAYEMLDDRWMTWQKEQEAINVNDVENETELVHYDVMDVSRVDDSRMCQDVVYDDVMAATVEDVTCEGLAGVEGSGELAVVGGSCGVYYNVVEGGRVHKQADVSVLYQKAEIINENDDGHRTNEGVYENVDSQKAYSSGIYEDPISVQYYNAADHDPVYQEVDDAATICEDGTEDIYLTPLPAPHSHVF